MLQFLDSFQMGLPGLTGAGSLLPVGGATLDVDFARGRYTGMGLGDITAFRSSPGVGETLDGNFVEFAANVPRITDKGLAGEETRINRVPWSQDFMQGAWLKAEATVALDPAVTTPFGTPAAAITENAGMSGAKGVTPSQAFTFTAGVAETFSVIVRPGGRNWLRLFVDGNGATNPFASGLVSCFVNLDTGAVGVLGTGSVKVQRLANGFWHVQWTFVPDQSTATGRAGVRATTGDGVATYLGDGRLAIYIAHMQLEAGAWGSTPIKSNAAAVTRHNDVTQGPLGSWFNQSAGTILAIGLGWDTVTATQVLVSIDDTTTAERLQIRRTSTGGATALVVDDNVVVASFSSGGAMPVGVPGKIAMTYALNDAQLAVNGTLNTADNLLTLPVPNRIEFANGPGSARLNGYLQRVAFFPRRLTNAELQALTA